MFIYRDLEGRLTIKPPYWLFVVVYFLFWSNPLTGLLFHGACLRWWFISGRPPELKPKSPMSAVSDVLVNGSAMDDWEALHLWTLMENCDPRGLHDRDYMNRMMTPDPRTKGIVERRLGNYILVVYVSFGFLWFLTSWIIAKCLGGAWHLVGALIW